ncbi:MAG: transketolase, partial [Aquificota bacterium]
IRLASMAGLQVVYVFTHDSIGLGEDGPTHQPVEHLSSLRLIPNLRVIRPADAEETAIAWDMAIQRKEGPTALILTRQKLPLIDRAKYPPAEGIRRGAYTLLDCDGFPELIILASGSEVHPALKAGEMLQQEGLKVRVINMASFEVFEEQEEDYKKALLPPEIKRRVAVEAGRGLCWHRYVGTEGLVIGLETFGKSAPGDVLMEYFGFTAESIIKRIKEHFRL